MTFLTVSFQSSDSEVRRLSEQLSQKDEVVQKLQKEREHLVELSQVRVVKVQCWISLHSVQWNSIKMWVKIQKRISHKASNSMFLLQKYSLQSVT